MKNYFKAAIRYTIMILLFTQCKQLYDPQVEAKNINLLVVEGYLNSGQGPTIIHLSRTADLKDTTILNPETGAQVIVEGGNGINFTLTSNTDGKYSISQLPLDDNVKYRLHIKTRDGKEYVSDYSPVKHTPPIDSISWQMENDGVQIYVNSHDDQNNTKFYRWTYSETWEFHSRFLKTVHYIIDPVTHQAVGIVSGAADTTIYKCWKTQNSTNIILGSTEKLSRDKVYLPVRYIGPQLDELTVLYYIQLKQYALSHDAYFFYQKMKKNTEQLGSIFDPMPSELRGNIHCVNDPDEIVIGYVEPSEAQEKELFIHNSDLPITWISQLPCSEFEVQNKPPLDVSIWPTRAGTLGPFNSIVTFYASDRICVDCTARGTNQKPAFWP